MKDFNINDIIAQSKARQKEWEDKVEREFQESSLRMNASFNQQVLQNAEHIQSKFDAIIAQHSKACDLRLSASNERAAVDFEQRMNGEGRPHPMLSHYQYYHRDQEFQELQRRQMEAACFNQ